MDMNTMNLVPTIPATNMPDNGNTVDLTTLNAPDLEAWFADAGLGVAEVSHCASARCPVCFPRVDVEAARAA